MPATYMRHARCFTQPTHRQHVGSTHANAACMQHAAYMQHAAQHTCSIHAAYMQHTCSIHACMQQTYTYMYHTCSTNATCAYLHHECNIHAAACRIHCNTQPTYIPRNTHATHHSPYMHATHMYAADMQHVRCMQCAAYTMHACNMHACHMQHAPHINTS